MRNAERRSRLSRAARLACRCNDAFLVALSWPDSDARSARLATLASRTARAVSWS